jgi:bifunctional DNA-binding transcriptional regulator/antitoxin component of YhaV-PrlF toxin-antitoxin module
MPPSRPEEDAMARSSSQQPTPLTVYGFVGNLGCIRFPAAVRKASKIKRGDRLMVLGRDGGGMTLEKLDLPDDVGTSELRVEGCACEQPPELCGRGPREIVGVGWSYVQLNRELATELGFLPDVPLRLVAQPAQIVVEPVLRSPEHADVQRMSCPP